MRGFSNDLNIRLSASTLAVASGAWSLRSKLIDGTYPDYARALPPRSPNPVRVDRAAMLAAVARIAQIARDTDRRGMTLEVAAGELCLSGGASGQLGGAEDVLAITGGASPARVHLNTKYLTDALRSIEAATVELHIGLPMQAVWFCAADEARDGALVLPMRG
jgi:DNA polymerase-3 subunit beta